MNEQYIQAVIIGVLVGGAILLAEMIDAGNVQGPAIAESMSPNLVPNKSANELARAKRLAVQVEQMESMDDRYRRKCFANCQASHQPWPYWPN